MESVNQVLLRNINSGSILQTIRDCAPISRADICERLGLAPSTISVITKELQERGLIRECGRATSTMGRRRVLIEINPSGGHFICADLSGSQLNVGVLNLSFERVRTWDFPMAGRTGEELYDYLASVLKVARDWCVAEGLTVFNIGIATPGLVEPGTGVVVEADNLSWHELDLQSRLQKAFDCPAWVENDTNTAAYGEYSFGYGKDLSVSNMMYVTIGTGIGAGLILNGNMYAGLTGMAGEIGHVVVAMDGPVCICGNRGCLESIASAQSLIRDYRYMAKLNDEAEMSIERLIELAETDNHVARALVHRAGRAIGLAVGGQVNILNLNSVLFGGLAHQSSVLFEAISEGVDQAVLPKLRNHLDIRKASLGLNATFIGMASLSMDRMVRALDLSS